MTFTTFSVWFVCHLGEPSADDGAAGSSASAILVVVRPMPRDFRSMRRSNRLVKWLETGFRPAPAMPLQGTTMAQDERTAFVAWIAGLEVAFVAWRGAGRHKKTAG
jgi:hypothetical protein